MTAAEGRPTRKKARRGGAFVPLASAIPLLLPCLALAILTLNLNGNNNNPPCGTTRSVCARFLTIKGELGEKHRRLTSALVITKTGVTPWTSLTAQSHLTPARYFCPSRCRTPHCENNRGRRRILINWHLHVPRKQIMIPDAHHLTIKRRVSDTCRYPQHQTT